jgi:hypothetical protein
MYNYMSDNEIGSKTSMKLTEAMTVRLLPMSIKQHIKFMELRKTLHVSTGSLSLCSASQNSSTGHCQPVESSFRFCPSSSTISLLQTQLSAVLSLLGIAEHDIEPANHKDDNNSSTLVNNANRATDQSSWSTVVAKNKMQKSTKNFQQSLIAAVYNDQTESKRRASSLIISGLSEDQQHSDAEQFLNLCRDEFNMQPAVVLTKRLGRVEPNKSRPLLVVTRKADQAQQLITAAKQLRKSANQSVGDNVYISRN